ncbi:growth hormone secretagogue receptor type 1 [Austrofundulus limnaeus]|uniref:Growth hormone secretagogue receptor type 1 n=1 Tax=Austrofundulus limnaeus TaxID=52670 RepID=A0A2I4CAA9_AUSLI|nr:PREDICTED: growth hormone secretagogue receptor type 1-like [Austrofundulus limnaeus]
MDLNNLGDTSGECDGANCSLASRFSENCTNQDCYWEEPMFGLIELVCVTVIYISLMIFGLLGNILTILVVWLRPHMRSSTYLYLSSMAVSDLLILLLLPLDLYKLWRPRPWPLGDLACKLTMFLSECCTFCTILHITFLSLERYLAVCWPITAKTIVTRHRTRVIIGCLWLGAAVSAAPVLVMVGVEEVGGEELGLNQWREDRAWTGREGKQGGLVMGGEERGGAHMALIDVGLEEAKLPEKGGGEVREFNFKSEVNEWKQGGEGELKDAKGAAEEADEEWKTEFAGDQQNKKKEDEGGGKERPEGSGEGDTDRRECRCTHYAISSGLLSAMMILSNLYFLVPLCILGLVYSLIGRTLWLRPKSSRRDQSHRNTVKMLGVIVLAFVLCWLPFHVGRTIFSLSLGSGADRQEANTDPNSHFDMNTDANKDISLHADPEVISHPDSDESLSQPGNAAVNPLLYNLMSGRYRLAIRSLVQQHPQTRTHRLRTITTRQSTTTL